MKLVTLLWYTMLHGQQNVKCTIKVYYASWNWCIWFHLTLKLTNQNLLQLKWTTGTPTPGTNGGGGILILMWKRNLLQEVVSQTPSSTPARAASLSCILCRLSLRGRRKFKRRNACGGSEFIILHRRFRCSLLMLQSQDVSLLWISFSRTKLTHTSGCHRWTLV
jgi:hypothetical protein